MLSLPAPRNWVQKNGAKRRSRRSWNWLCSVSIRESCMSAKRCEIVLHQNERVLHGGNIEPEPDFLADLFALQHAGPAQHAKVVRHRGPRERRRRHDLADVEAFAGL